MSSKQKTSVRGKKKKMKKHTLHEKLLKKYIGSNKLREILEIALSELFSNDFLPKNPYPTLFRSLNINNL